MGSQRKNYSSFSGTLPGHMQLDDIMDHIKETDDMEIVTTESRQYLLDNRYSIDFSPANIAAIMSGKELFEKFVEKPLLKAVEAINPLDLVNEKENELMNYKEKAVPAHLSEQKYLESKLPVIQFDELKMISIKIAPSSSYNSIAPSALAASENLILIGNTSGCILVFSQSGQELSVLKPKKGFGQVTCIDITKDELFAIAGYHFGQVCLWDLKKNSAKKSNALHKSPVLSAKFWKENKDCVISGDLSGKVMLLEFQKKIISTSINNYELLRDDVGSIVCIEPLYPEPLWPHPTDTNRIVAIAGTKKVVIYTLEPEIQTIFVIDKPIGTADLACPCISWKIAMAPEDPSPLHHILAVAWGQRIVLYTFKFATSEGIFISGYLETDTEIKGLFWLSYEIILALNRSREIQVISSREFSNKMGENGRRAILEETYANKDLALQLYIKIDKKENFTYHNTLKSKNRVVYLLGNKEFHKGQLLNWKECIEELTKKNEWLEALALGLNLYQSRGKKLHGVPKDKVELRASLQEFVEKFLKVILLSWPVKIAAAVEYCVGIEALDFFFTTLFDQIIGNSIQENTQTLMATLEPYILDGQIKVIPNEALEKMIGFYLSTKQNLAIERIICHLEPTCIEAKHVLPACEEHNLLTAYIFINTNSTMQSFVNPLKKIYKTMTKQKDIRAKLYFTYKLLWYFRLCLKGETFPAGKILPEMVNVVISGILKWLIKRKHLQGLLIMDSMTTLNVVWLAFEGKISSDIISGQVEKAPSFMDIIKKLQEICPPPGFLYHQFHLFVLKTASLEHVTLAKEVYLETSKYVLTNKRPSSMNLITGKDIDEYINNVSKQSEKNQVFVEFSTDQKGEILLKLLKKHQLSYKEIDETYKLAVACNEHFTEVIIYLLELKKDYSKAVREFIESTNYEIKRKVFPWLNSVFKSLNDVERETLKTDLMVFLTHLVDIDSDQFAKLVTDCYQNKHLEIVRKLNSAPKLQMKYLGELVKDPIDQDLLFRYISLLCQHDSRKVLEFLESREDYDLDKCLNECLRFQVVEAAAYLYEKIGSVKDALDLLLKRVEACKKDFLNNTNSFGLIKSIEKDIKQSITLCSRNISHLDTQEIEEYFFAVLQAVLELYRDLSHIFPVNPALELIIHTCIKVILEQMMLLVNFDTILDFIISRFDKIPFKHFKENIFQVLSQHSYQKNIVKKAINLLGNDVKSMTSRLYNVRSSGVNSEGFCVACNMILYSEKREKVIIFICGHGFHRKCVKGGQCSLCSATQQKMGAGIISASK